MHERVGAETQDSSEPAVVPVARTGAVAERMLALQRSAGNAAVNRLIARQPAGLGIDTRPTQFVFLLGAKDDEGLEVARQHYRSPLMSSVFRKVVEPADLPDPSLDGVLAYLRKIDYPIAEITLVVHGNPTGEIQIPLNAADRETDKLHTSTTPDELEKAMDDGVLKPLEGPQITTGTRIRLQACFAGEQGPRMVNLLDKAFGKLGTVIAPTVEVAYAKNVWHSEGLSGWIIRSPAPLTTEEIAVALKAKYGAALGGLDLTTYQEDVGTHHKGETMKDDDEMWAELARGATEETDTTAGAKQWVYVTNRFVQGIKPGYEDNPVLYTKSSYYYMPEEL